MLVNIAEREKILLFSSLCSNKAALKPLSWPDRIDYIWTYYKWTLVIVFIALVLILPLIIVYVLIMGFIAFFS